MAGSFFNSVLRGIGLKKRVDHRTPEQVARGEAMLDQFGIRKQDAAADKATVTYYWNLLLRIYDAKAAGKYISQEDCGRAIDLLQRIKAGQFPRMVQGFSAPPAGYLEGYLRAVCPDGGAALDAATRPPASDTAVVDLNGDTTSSGSAGAAPATLTTGQAVAVGMLVVGVLGIAYVVSRRF